MAGADYGRIKDPARFEHYVYRLLNKKGRTLYVGCSMNLNARIAEHRRHGAFGHLFVDYATQGPFNFQDARKLERHLILTERPPFNTEYRPQSYMRNGRLVTPQPKGVAA